eukprot:16909-Heterococcus_DN1.PRE.1
MHAHDENVDPTKLAMPKTPAATKSSYAPPLQTPSLASAAVLLSINVQSALKANFKQFRFEKREPLPNYTAQTAAKVTPQRGHGLSRMYRGGLATSAKKSHKDISVPQTAFKTSSVTPFAKPKTKLVFIKERRVLSIDRAMSGEREYTPDISNKTVTLITKPFLEGMLSGTITSEVAAIVLTGQS